MKKVHCQKTGHGTFMTAECKIRCDQHQVNTCDVESLENKNPFDDVKIDHL